MSVPATGCDKPKSFLPRDLGGWVDVIAKVGAIFAVAWGIVQFREAQRAGRVTRTQELMVRHGTDPVLSARNTISRVLRDSAPVIQDLRSVALDPGAAAQAHKDVVQYFVNESRGGVGLAAEIDAVVDFYRTVEVCVEQELCEETVAVAYFAGEAKRLVDNFRPYLTERRTLAPDYAVAVEKLADRNRPR
jgi:hypothetical protein